jgi:dephospho-CoA kinase
MRDRGNDHRPRRVIVTGGIGSGKSTVAAMLGDLGATVIEADRIGHEVLAPGGPCFREVAEAWPAAVENGEIDRGRLAAIVFADPAALVRLERITHPVIAARIREEVAAAAGSDVVVELPLSVELLPEEWVVLLVTAEDDVRAARSVGRGMDAGDVAARMARPARIDVVIENDGDLVSLRRRVAAVWDQVA